MARKASSSFDSTSRRSFLKAASLGAAAASFGAPFILNREAQAADKVRVGYLPVNVMLPVYSEKAGFWKDAGLDIELYRAQGGPAILQALTSGDVPVGDVGVGPAILAAARGLPFYFLTLASVMTPEHPLDRIMVKKDSPIRNFRDLKGKTLAINQKGTQPDAALGAAEKVFGIAKSEINIVPVPYPNMPQVLEQGQVDAIYPFPPSDTIAEVNFGARTLAETSDFIPYIGFTTLAVRRDFADGNPKVMEQLIRGAIVGQRWINDNPDLSKRTANEFLKIPEAVAPKVRTAYWARNAMPSMANVWHLYELQVAGEIMKPVENVERMMNSYFVEPAMKFTLPVLEKLGVQPDPTYKKMLAASYPLLKKPAEEYLTKWDRDFLKL
jgi:ABC-type nitrate/sulfonate/bicarbonate transport system substrate-binding protein